MIFASIDPQPNFHLLDTFLARMELLEIPSLICFNKSDLDKDQAVYKAIEEMYRASGYPILYTSAKEQQGVAQLGRTERSGKIIVNQFITVGCKDGDGCYQ